MKVWEKEHEQAGNTGRKSTYLPRCIAVSRLRVSVSTSPAVFTARPSTVPCVIIGCSVLSTNWSSSGSTPTRGFRPHWCSNVTMATSSASSTRGCVYRAPVVVYLYCLTCHNSNHNFSTMLNLIESLLCIYVYLHLCTTTINKKPSCR